MYKKILMIALSLGLSISEHESLSALAPSSQFSDMFQAKSHQNIASSSKNGSLAQSTKYNPYLETFKEKLEDFHPNALANNTLLDSSIFAENIVSLLEENFAINIDLSLLIPVIDKCYCTFCHLFSQKK